MGDWPLDTRRRMAKQVSKMGRPSTRKGTAKEIRRLFEAERLDPAGLKNLQPEKDYAVLFLGFQMAAACA
jgi:hypothetical protein